MINLKLSKADKKKPGKAYETSSSDEHYPWGTRLRFEDETIQKIPALQNVKAGAVLGIRAVGKVVEVRVTDLEKGKKHEYIEIQIQQIELGEVNEAEKSFEEEG